MTRSPQHEFAHHEEEPQSEPWPLARCIDCGSVVRAEMIGRHMVAFHKGTRIYAHVYLEPIERHSQL